MGDRATLERIFAIMSRLLLVRMDGLNPIPRKGTTRHECYRALYEIQELLETRRCFGKHLPKKNADKVRQMSDEELADWFIKIQDDVADYYDGGHAVAPELPTMKNSWLDWLRQEAT